MKKNYSTKHSWWVAGAVALGLGFLVYHDKSKRAAAAGPGRVGTLAQKDDLVSVPISSLPVTGALSGLAALLPPGTVTGAGFAILRVDSVGNGYVTGPVTHYQVQMDQPAIPLLAITAPYTIPVSAITQVTRGGQPVA